MVKWQDPFLPKGRGAIKQILINRVTLQVQVFLTVILAKCGSLKLKNINGSTLIANLYCWLWFQQLVFYIIFVVLITLKYVYHSETSYIWIISEPSPFLNFSQNKLIRKAHIHWQSIKCNKKTDQLSKPSYLNRKYKLFPQKLYFKCYLKSNSNPSQFKWQERKYGHKSFTSVQMK